MIPPDPSARPFAPLTALKLIEKVYNGRVEHGAAVCGHPSIDTLKVSEDGASISHTVDREKIWRCRPRKSFPAAPPDAYAAVAARATRSPTTPRRSRRWALRGPGPPDGLNIKVTRKGRLGGRHPRPLPRGERHRVDGPPAEAEHDFANQITSLLGFAYLIDADCPEDSR